MAIVALVALACSPCPRPPETDRDPAVDTLHGLAITDDYRWLEDQDSPETRAWINAQNAYAELIVGDTPLRAPPLQARKMAARLQRASASGLPVILDYDPRAGHAGGRTFSRNVRNTAMELAFLWGQVGR